ncbi:unnamed protein product, partial [Caretta caretta]
RIADASGVLANYLLTNDPQRLVTSIHDIIQKFEYVPDYSPKHLNLCNLQS